MCEVGSRPIINMIRAAAKWWARISYLFTLEVEAEKNEINAATAGQCEGGGGGRRKPQAGRGIPNLSAQEKYEDEHASKKEKDAALQMVAEKRRLAAEEGKNVASAEHVTQVLRGRAHDSRAFADKIRAL
jgi:hypothetical protein